MRVSGLSGAVELSAGFGHSCALLSNGTAACWGYNAAGQLGNGTTTDSATPVPVQGIGSGSFWAMAHGPYTADSCAVTVDATGACWGYNDKGQLGNGTTISSSVSVPISGISGIAH